MRVEKSLIIRRPVHEVFAFLTDVESYPRWIPELLSARKTSDGPMGIGATWNGKAGFLGQRLESDHEVTAFEPDRRYAFRTTTSPVPGRLEYTFEPVAEGTRVTFVGTVEPKGFFRLAGPLISLAGTRMYEANLGRLKELLEGQAPPASEDQSS